MKELETLKIELDKAERKLDRVTRFARWCESRVYAAETLDDYNAAENALQQAFDAVEAAARVSLDARRAYIDADLKINGMGK